ncbi:hypothetical protein E2I00_005714, partial [Balaenoptera physalus]
SKHQIFLWAVPLTYLVTIFGNLLTILASITDTHLHTLVHFFLSNLSLVDVFLSSTTVPKMLVNLWTQSQAIPFAGCLAQMYAFHLFGTIDSFLLAVMVHGHCHPLCYLAIMSPRVWGLLVGGPWLITNLQSLVHTCIMAPLTFCAGSEIPHFFCDVIPLPKLSGSDTHTNEPVIFPFGIILGISSLTCILSSYTSIFQAVFQILSAQLTPHRGVTILWHHLRCVPAACISRSSQKDKAAALMCGLVIPMLNPFIYSLRNKDMKAALRKLVGKWNERLATLILILIKTMCIGHMYYITVLPK